MMTRKKKIWVEAVNWEKLNETGELYEWATSCCFCEGEDTSWLMGKAAEKDEQIYLFVTKKQADNLRHQIEVIAKKVAKEAKRKEK